MNLQTSGALATEPVALTELVRAVALLATTFGIAINAEQQSALVIAIGALLTLGSIALAWYQRNHVVSPATAQKIANESTYLPAGTEVNINNPAMSPVDAGV